MSPHVSSTHEPSRGAVSIGCHSLICTILPSGHHTAAPTPGASSPARSRGHAFWWYGPVTVWLWMSPATICQLPQHVERNGFGTRYARLEQENKIIAQSRNQNVFFRRFLRRITYITIICALTY